MSNIVKNIVVALKGFAMGAANVIPGVSGGTIALLTGIFNELIEALNAVLSVSSWKPLLKGDFKGFWKAIHGTFLLWLAIGVIISVFSLAKLMEYVLAHHPVQTWAFFFGLIIVSAIFMLIDIKDWNPVIYQRYTTRSIAPLHRNLEWLAQNIDTNRITLRLPHIPDYNTPDDVSRSRESLNALGFKHFDELTYQT